eukprot:1832939-Pyramimonas_sp.AAC.1
MLAAAEEDINKVLKYFSYEHFYVIYCKFWELDTVRRINRNPSRRSLRRAAADVGRGGPIRGRERVWYIPTGRTNQRRGEGIYRSPCGKSREPALPRSRFRGCWCRGTTSHTTNSRDDVQVTVGIRALHGRCRIDHHDLVKPPYHLRIQRSIDSLRASYTSVSSAGRDDQDADAYLGRSDWCINTNIPLTSSLASRATPQLMVGAVGLTQ